MPKVPNNLSLILAVRKDKRENPHDLASVPSAVSSLLAAKRGDSEDDDDDESELGKKGIESCIKRFFEAGNKGDWTEAASAMNDLHELQRSDEKVYGDEDESIYDDHPMPMSDEMNS